MSLTIKQVETFLKEASLDYIANPTERGYDEVRYYAEQLLQLTQSV